MMQWHAVSAVASVTDASPGRCGILAHGFARVRCQACSDELLVGFSCYAVR